MRELEAEVVEAIGKAAIDELTTRRAFRHVFDNLDDETIADIRQAIGIAGKSAFLVLAQQRGWKVTARDDIYDIMESAVIEAGLLNSPDAHQAWRLLHDAAPLAPWMEEKNG